MMLEKINTNNRDNLFKSQRIRLHRESIVKEDNIFFFFFINSEGKTSLIKAEINKDNFQKQNKKINFNESDLNEKDTERYIKYFDGIIFIYTSKSNQILSNIIEAIHKIDKKNKKERIIAKIFFGNKTNMVNNLNRSKDKRFFYKFKDIKFLQETPNDNNKIICLALQEFINMKKLYDEYEEYIKYNKINEIDIINDYGKNKLNLMKCTNCNLVFNISINNFSNLFYLCCPKCKLEQKFNIEEFERFKNFVKCDVCKREININSRNYCYKCKKNICKDCTKSHLQREESNNNIFHPKINHFIYQSNFIDVMCSLHKRICNKFCIKCDKNICIDCEIESHMDHETTIFDESNINNLINEQKRIINLERKKSKKIKEIIEDCLNELRRYFESLVENKEKMLNIIEGMIKELESFKYDNTLIENIKNLNLQLNREILYNYKASWMKKLNDLLEHFNDPIKIKRTKLCEEENLKGPYDILKQVKIVSKNDKNEDINENITDICSLSDYNSENYFAVSYDSGVLKIYKDDFNNRVPIKIIDKEFEEKEGINSLYKSGRKSLILVGYSKIKKILFSEDFKKYNVINEFEMPNQLFKTVIELDCFDILIATNNLNQLLCINSKTGNLISDVTKSIDEKEILYIDKISENKIILMLNEFSLMKNIRVAQGSIIEEDLKLDINGSLLMSNNEIYNPNKSKNIFWRLLGFDIGNNNIDIIKNHTFNKNISYLGKLNDTYILLFNNETKQNKLVIFDINSYSNIIEISFNYVQKPVVSFAMNKRTTSLDILILLEEGNIIQYTLNLMIGEIYPKARVKINNINSLNNNLFTLNGENNNENKHNIVKIINLRKTNFMLITEESSIFNLKN